MRCHHIFEEVSNKKILIPGCWNVVHSNDFTDCTCYPKKEPTQESIELKELKEEIKILKNELNAHIRIIEKLVKIK